MQNSDSKKDEDEYALVKVLKQLLSYLSLFAQCMLFLENVNP